jgi:FkbM family methyltransferase
MELISNTEKLFLNWVRENITGEITCLDIGANKGFYSTGLLEQLGDKVKSLHCFEPVPHNFDYCTQKFENNPIVTLHLNACSNEKKDLPFYQIISDDFGFEGLSSLHNRAIFNEFNKQEIIVSCVVLNDILEIDTEDEIFAKIDVEGHELEVLEGMSKFFKSEQIKAVQFEYGHCILEQNKNLRDIVNLLKEFDKYSIYDFTESQELIKIDDTNIENYINVSWSNLYIIKK